MQHRYARGDGRSGFASPDLGQRLRRLAFTAHGMRPPEQAQLPRTITVFRAAEGEEARLSAPPAEASACLAPGLPPVAERLSLTASFNSMQPTGVPSCCSICTRA